MNLFNCYMYYGGRQKSEIICVHMVARKLTHILRMTAAEQNFLLLSKDALSLWGILREFKKKFHITTKLKYNFSWILKCECQATIHFCHSKGTSNVNLPWNEQYLPFLDPQQTSNTFKTCRFLSEYLPKKIRQ